MAMATLAQALTQGLRHHQAGQLPRAEQIYRQILAQQPVHADALHLLGALALQTGRRDEAMRLLEEAVAADPTIAVYHGNLASAYLTAGRYEEARGALQQAIRRDPAFAEAYYNLGVVLYNLGRLDEAVAAYRHCLELRAGNASAHDNLGDLLRELGRFDLALAHLEQALAADPQSPKAHYDRALVLLSLGRLEEGWAEYEWRWRCREFTRRQLAEPTWDGSPLTDKTLLIHAEQGLGDTIQFIRYLPLVRQRCGDVLVEVQANLVPLFTCSGWTGLVAQRAPLPYIDVQLPMLSLPGVFGTTLETIPATVPYLKARPDLVDSWRQKLSRYSQFKVGIVWQGSPSYREDRYRSIPLPYFAPLAQVPGVQLFSLQKGPGSEQLSMLRSEFNVVDLGNIDTQSGPFMDSAAIMKNLDLVISSDTASAHLAGALGVPVWLALRIAPDWRWLTYGVKSPWYPSMRLFRQKQFGDWPGVFDEIAIELRRMVHVV